LHLSNPRCLSHSFEHALPNAHPDIPTPVCPLSIAAAKAACRGIIVLARQSSLHSRTALAGVGFAGICGFGGGFGRRMLNAWGEPLIKQFVQESISHAIRLEQALVKLQTDRRIVVLHYSPIRATLEGEDPEIYAFLGSSRLEEPINRFRATAVFHVHAHNGITDGKTSTGIPVYNVSAPVLDKTGKPYRIIEL